MIGIIVMGHGTFATGLTSGLQLLVGKPVAYETVDFLPEDSGELLEEKLSGAVERLHDCEGILVLADLVGGTPFNIALRLKLEKKEKLEVIGGSNLAVAIAAYMSREMVEDVSELASSSAQSGREQLVHYVQGQSDDDDYEE